MKLFELMKMIEGFNNIAKNIINETKKINSFDITDDIIKNKVITDTVRFGEELGKFEKHPMEYFKELINSKNKPRILELGTKRSNVNLPTHHKEWVSKFSEYICSDIEPGVDVDLVCDSHKLLNYVEEESYDGIISCSTFEHFKYPWIVAEQIGRALRVQGLIFIQTHQSFPLHGFPSDYYRFSPYALNALFPSEYGFEIVASTCEFPCVISSDQLEIVPIWRSYLNTCITIRKTKSYRKAYNYSEVV